MTIITAPVPPDIPTRLMQQNSIFASRAHNATILPIIHLWHHKHESFLHEVIDGLLAEQKFLPTKYLYDQHGSELFERITALPEYYLTRSEQEILHLYADDIISHAHTKCWLVELGSGSGKKTRRLLQALQEQYTNVEHHASSEYSSVRYVPIDIAGEFLAASAQAFQHDFPNILIHPICAEFMQGMEYIAQQRNAHAPNTQLLVYFPGSTIGNLTHEEARTFLRQLRSILHLGDAFLLATDIDTSSSGKPIDVLHYAYNDQHDVTAAFNLNILHRINRELHATIPVEAYQHCAYYNAALSRIEMYLESRYYHTFSVSTHTFSIAKGERIRTEYSHKFSDSLLQHMASQTGFIVKRSWYDTQRFFRLSWLSPC
ncbi:MAG: L-histidine N(alpha)-methyltransferase [Bacteroidota bacterium]|nr:L-histidine N(alpha)-methyltransferase [Candidatus Kapabacteria bacterium]MDW8220904.1 L-histidine N(alpha)-methyltransferase [Bacteroidota bacterium]